MKYLWREKKKQGIEDLRKAKWYLDRLVGRLDADAIADGLAGAWEPSEDRVPSGWRKMEIGEDIDANDKFWFCTNWMSYEKDNLPRGKLTGLHVTHIRKIETPTKPPKPSKTQPPNGYRLLGPAKDEPRIEGDRYWSLRARAWCWIEQEIVEYANRDNWPACRKIETPSESFKRYREPTKADLANGPIECEVRDCDIQAWRKAKLRIIYPDAAYQFQVQKHDSLHEIRYAQCRIEVR